MLKVGENIFQYVGDCSAKRNQAYDRFFVIKYQIVDMIPKAPDTLKPTVVLKRICNDEANKLVRRHSYADVTINYRIKEID